MGLFVVKRYDGAFRSGTMVVAPAVFKHMKSGGRIIMSGSSVGGRAMTPGLVAYSATKGAVKMFTHCCPERSVAAVSRSTTFNQGRSIRIGIPRRASGQCPRRPPQRLTATDMLIEVAALVAFVAVCSPRSSPG